ncbi:MAG TPA: dihydropteroate synthase [Acidimicrobiales bacterium]|nr:dihydropteroate synthase [Acidimicrobiales bacterium]
MADGADVLEVAGPQPGPGGEVPADGLDRLVTAVGALVSRLDVAVAVATDRADVAAAAFAAGATMGDDRSGFSDPGYLPAAARVGVCVVATAVPGAPGADVVAAMEASLRALADRAAGAGIRPERVVVDAGLDLDRPADQWLAGLRASDLLAALGHPLLLSPGAAAPAAGAVADLGREAGLAAISVGVALGCRLVRTTDVRGARRVCDAVAAVLEAE